MSVKVIKKFPDVNDFTYNYREWNRQFIEQNVILNGRYAYLYYPAHWTTLSFKFAFGGNEHYIFEKMKYSVNDGNFLILNRDTIYESLIDSDKSVESFTMNFTEKFVDDVFYSSFNSDEYLLNYPEIRDKNPVNFFQKLYPNDDVVRFYVRELRNLSSVQFPDQNRINEIMHSILEYIFRLQLNLSKEADTIDSAKRSTRYELYKRLNIAKDYINSNFSEPVNLEKLSSVSCMCPHHLLRKFKSHFGITPHQYLTHIRLESAKSQIESGTVSITEICFSSGYESLSSFSYLFRKRYKNSPEIHRKIHLKKVNFQIA